MKQFLSVLLAASLPVAALAETPVTMSDEEINNQTRLNSIACKSAGLDDGGAICGVALDLSRKYAQAKQVAVKAAADKAKEADKPATTAPPKGK